MSRWLPASPSSRLDWLIELMPEEGLGLLETACYQQLTENTKL